MQPEGPYRFTHPLGGSPVGTAWAAIDEHGRLVTVAVLDATVAGTAGWREAFAGTANTLAQGSDAMSFAYADFSATAPWVAYPAEAGPGAEKLFRALGVEYTAAPALPVSAPPVSASPVSSTPVSSPPPVSGAPRSAADMPHAPWAVHANPVSSQPVSASPQPVSGAPTSPSAADTMAGTPVDVPGPPIAQTRPVVPLADPFAAPVRRIKLSEPRPRRTGLWAGAAALVLVVLAGVGGVVIWGGGSDDPGKPQTGPTTSILSPAIPTTPPQSPGIEPPKPGAWPTQWPRFNERDTVRTLTDLDGLGFPVKVPTTWQCTLAARAEGIVKYQCGTAATGNQAIGGEVIVRECPQPCTDQWQNAMRSVEEAWGAQWIRSGLYASYAEQIIEVDGTQRHGLVVVAYFRSGEEGAINRQLVIRMTSPVPEAYQLRRFASYIRDVVVF
ncbi:hypothetical protein F8271_00085 [Micromonospora sp. ALFpr18c]|uniref:hypothetical protein n=1 Tax=Micromonospora sp. ALFpr18c TaxID=1458665 RepID=UPI00124B2DA7|nr:hypothetical protein [Micromonospora sp. ALFpr18c]KAB1949683.1 hypothetical protein F8271_00085 [Micromonospora sp. ALFpr18c]